MAPALDSRRGHEVVASAVGIAIAADEAREIEASPGIDTIYRSTATGVNVCQMRTHLRWMKRHVQDLLGRASTAMHCKDWLYFRLTGVRATDTRPWGRPPARFV